MRIPNATTENSKDKQNEFFKKGYTLANVKDNEEQEGIVSSSSADSLLSHGNEPPRYDEIMPLMSDEE